jgi:ferredoxin
MRENYCDGLGDCLPSCPAGAITFEEREAPDYDHAAVLAARALIEGAEKAKNTYTQKNSALRLPGRSGETAGENAGFTGSAGRLWKAS